MIQFSDKIEDYFPTNIKLRLSCYLCPECDDAMLAQFDPTPIRKCHRCDGIMENRGSVMIYRKKITPEDGE